MVVCRHDDLGTQDLGLGHRVRPDQAAQVRRVVGSKAKSIAGLWATSHTYLRWDVYRLVA